MKPLDCYSYCLTDANFLSSLLPTCRLNVVPGDCTIDEFVGDLAFVGVLTFVEAIDSVLLST